MTGWARRVMANASARTARTSVYQCCPTSGQTARATTFRARKACSHGLGPDRERPARTPDYDLWSCDDLCGRVGGWCGRGECA